MLINRPGLRVDYLRAMAGRSILVASFSQRVHGAVAAEELAGMGFGTPKLLELGFDVLAIKTDRPVWYANLGDPDCVLINAALATVEQPHRVRCGYGSSMGAYGAIRFSQALGLSRVLALSPLFDITAKWDMRWQQDVAAMTAAPHVSLPMVARQHIDPDREYFMAYDPHDRDRLHIAQFRNLIGDRLHEMRLPFAGHPAGFFLLQLGLLETVVEDVLGNGRWPRLAPGWRKAKTSSPDYLFTLTQACIDHGHWGWAARLNPRVLEGRGHLAESHLQAFLIARQMGDYMGARAALDRALEIDPENSHIQQLITSHSSIGSELAAALQGL